MTIDRSEIERSFDASTIDRGYRYYKLGHVLRVGPTHEADSVAALVSGSRQHPYSVLLRKSRARGVAGVSGTCSCPVRHNCKHVAAAAFAIAEDDAAPDAEAGSGAVEMWIQELREQYEQTLITQALESREHIRYAIDLQPAPYTPTLTLSAFIGAIRKSGERGTPRPYEVRNVAFGHHNATTPIDRTIGQLAEAAGLADDLGRAFSPTLVGALLEILMRTQRLHWRFASDPVLRNQALDSAHITWSLDARGRQRPHLDGRPSTILLPSVPLWYVDPENHVAGIARVEAPAPIVAMIARSPALSPAQAERAYVSLRHVFTPGAIDAPAANVEVEAIDANPIPLLRLFSMNNPRANPYDPRRAVAELSFVYGDHVVNPGEPIQEFQTTQGERVTVWARRFSFEHAALARLQKEGLTDLRWPYEVERERVVLTYAYDDDRWLKFFRGARAALALEGWRVEVDRSFPFAIAQADGEWYADVIETDSTQWFEFELGIDVNGQRVSLIPLLLDALDREGYTVATDPQTIARRTAPLLGKLESGMLVELPAARVARVLATIGVLFGESDAEAGDERMRMPALRAASLWGMDGIAVRWNNAEPLRALVEDLTAQSQQRLVIPKRFKATLRGYQRDGVAWLQMLRRHGFGGILADDMGLGKTVQLLAHVAIERPRNRRGAPVLVVAPTSVVPNWRAEIARFLPSARVVTLTGKERAARFPEIDDADIALTSYALLQRDIHELEEREWSMFVLDEAQAIKNPRSKGAAAALRIQAGQRIALTGTPVENHLEELWSLYNATVPGLLSDRTRFARVFRAPIETRGDNERRRALAARIKPFFLRRTKENVALELPEKSEIVQRIELSGAQRDLYETIRTAMHKRVRDEVSKRGLARSRIVVLDALLKLRQVCCDPRLLKVAAAQNVEESQKLEALLEMLDSLVEDGRRILLFSQFTSMLDLIKPELQKRGQPFVELRGDTRDRETPVAQFQRGETPLFLISLKAGGTGLNLTAADTVIHYDPWWNPAVERQATDRAHRIGQTQRVFVYKLIAEGTVEERILELQERKGALAAGLFEEASSGTLDLGMNDIEALFS